MPKNNFLLVDLNETRTKKLAETITSNTSRKILNYLAEKEHDTESSIAKSLSIPISTVHYHLQKLQEAKLITVKEFHYSKKGREVNHYKLANKYIIIAPQKVSGLKEKLKGILPVAIATLGITAIIRWIQTSSFTHASITLSEGAKDVASSVATESVASITDVAAEEAGRELFQATPEQIAYEAPKIVDTITQQPDIALWFLLGSAVTIILYIIIMWIKEKRKK